MHLDSPAIIAQALPGLVRTTDAVWEPFRGDPFAVALGRNMGTAGLVTAVADPVSAMGVPEPWSELFLVAAAPRSQYDALRETLSACGPPLVAVACVALAGAGFHGQHGRPWTVVAGNLHLSAILPCDLPADRFAAVMPALPAVAVAEAVAELGAGRLDPGIKWVNDVLLDGRKVAGSLTALRTQQGRITAVVLGIGLNVAAGPDPAASDPVRPATSLAAELGRGGPTLEQSLRRVLSGLAVRWRNLVAAGPEELLATYRELSVLLGRTVAVWPDSGPAARPLAIGVVASIAPDLSLRLAGRKEPVTNGRVTLLDAGTR